MVLQSLVNRIDRYLIGAAALKELEAWLVANLQAILDSRDSRAIELANQLDADLVELGEGIIDAKDFRERLEAYRRQGEMILEKGDARVTTIHAVVAHSSNTILEYGNKERSNSLQEATHVFAA